MSSLIDDLEALQQRNAERAREAIARLGARYVLHPTHAPRKAAPVAPVLTRLKPY